MHPQLAAIAAELRDARARLHRLVADVPGGAWNVRPRPDRWSPAECVEHLNLTTRAFLPPIDAALDGARALGTPAAGRYRRDPLGWLLWRTMGPPVRFRARTTAAFVPGAPAEPAASLADFDHLQDELLRRVAAADGLPIDRVRLASPFGAGVRYDLYSALSILPRHQHRHLWQAERANGR